MKQLIALAAAAVAIALATPATAANLTLDFEGVGSFASVANYYNGGSDSAGTAGTNRGVTFTGAALALSNDILGPYFSHAPSPGSVMFASDASALMNIAAGFVDELSFYYSASSSALDVVTIYSGLNGTGNVLGTLGLGANAQLGGCNDAPLCNWQRVALSFAGVGHSVSFGGNAGGVAFDNIAVTAIPEPGTWALFAAGLAGMAIKTRRRVRADQVR